MKVYNVLEQDALNFLRENYTAVVATCFEGVPHATVVYYDVGIDFCLYFITKKNTQKNIHTAFNSSVAFVVGTGPEHITVQGRGEAMLLSGDEKLEVLNQMIARYTAEGIDKLPIEHMNILREQRAVVYKIIPKELLFMNMDSIKYPRSISTSYHKII